MIRCLLNTYCPPRTYDRAATDGAGFGACGSAGGGGVRGDGQADLLDGFAGRKFWRKGSGPGWNFRKKARGGGGCAVSIHAMNTVWQESKAGGTLLLLELALADHARDSGWSWPGIESLARKTRMTSRSVINLIQQLEDMGELFVRRRDGPYNTNLYLLLLVSKGKFPNPEQEAEGDTLSGVKKFHGEKVSPVKKFHGENGHAPFSPNPSGTVTSERVEILNGKTPEGSKGGNGAIEWPSLEDVLKAAAEYPGSLAKGIPPKMPEQWARDHFHIRTFDKRDWAPDWRKAMASLFENQWQSGYASARGEARQVSFGRPGFGVQKKNGGGRERGEILQQIEIARRNGITTTQLEQELEECR